MAILQPFVSFILSSFLSFPLLASAASPPDGVVLLIPQSQVQVNSIVCAGWSQPSDEMHYYGFIEAVNISFVTPNGTNTGGIGVNTMPNATSLGSCGYYPGSTYSGCISANDTGTYTILWNFTYTMSSDPKKANATYCGPAPFSTQIFLLNETFEAMQTTGEATGFTNTEFTTSTKLPTKPTGDLQVGGAPALQSPGMIGWIGVAAVTLGMILTM